MDDDYDEDDYSAIGEPDDDALFADLQDGPGLFDFEDTPQQDGPDLFGNQPDLSKAKVVAAAMRPPREDEPSDEPAPEPGHTPSAETGSAKQAAAEPTKPTAKPTKPALASKDTQAAATSSAPSDTAPLALYRRYRPDTFADVIGQEHVTDPLQRALINNRVNHAYLFSGPRGCGKTTSARILARCLNCAVGPTPTPCGECQSCRDLARGGPGSIDVIEIDAASHGGVDDARDLRERAFFAPVHSRYKIYIVDEAHMVTTAGFNALLKLVEEPPPHVKFIFATTEPEKVIGTIRSRTHHYPFRLVPPRVLTDYLARLCEAEGVPVEASVLPIVVRAGAGSVRDSLSVLDQLLGAAGNDGVGYTQAAALLGYTPDALLDEIVDAFAAGDAAAVFGTIDKVIDVGQDPRRFAEDLLRRLRDLIIVAAVPDAATTGLIDVAHDQAQRLATQVAGLGRGELTRAAEVLASGLTEMRGTTAPRLHLELMCARVLLPGADVDDRGLHARIDRLERRVGMLGDQAPPAQWDDVPAREPAPPAPHPASKPQQRPSEPPREQRPVEQRPATPPAQRPAASPEAPAQRPASEARPAGQRPAPSSAPKPPEAEQRGTPRSLTAVDLRRVWPNILQRIKERRRYTWLLLSQHAQVVEVADGKLTLGFGNPGARDSFAQRGNPDQPSSVDILHAAIVDEIGVQLQVVSVLAEHPTDVPQQRPVGSAPAPTNVSTPPPAPPEPEPQISEDDEELVDEGLSVAELLASRLGAEVIHEEPIE